MRELGPATNKEMVLAFIRAEIDSTRWGCYYIAALTRLGRERKYLIDNADLNDGDANRDRENVLGVVRGYGRGEYLFKKFPTDTIWRRVSFDPSELCKLKYINATPFSLLSDMRSVEVGAHNYRSVLGELVPTVEKMVSAVRLGVSLPELILVEDAGSLVVFDGNTRATAYVNAPIITEFSALVGSSPTMHQWPFI
jgi:hypothetical protein